MASTSALTTPEVQIEVVPDTPPQVSIQTTIPVLTPAHSLDAVFIYLHTQATGNVPRLVDSYAKTTTFDDGDTAWTYDNSLAILALLARGEAADLATARTLADALVYAQAHDPQFDDGRIRDSYHASAFIRADKRANVDRGGSATGNMAWAVLALVRASERLGDTAYLAAAQRLGQWIFDNTSDERGAGGYTGGVAEGGGQLHWKATEHNADVYAAFMNLHRVTADPAWRERALLARHFLTTMWNEQDGFFWTGTTEDGATPNPRPVPEDAQSWTPLALGELERYRRALDWADSTLRYKACPGYEAASGYRFSDVGSGCWWEGTAHMALAWRAAGEAARADELLQHLRGVRKGVPGLAGEAISAASGDPAVSGFGWSYPAQTPHLGATAWYLFAEVGHNPFWGLAVTEPIPFAGIH